MSERQGLFVKGRASSRFHHVKLRVTLRISFKTLPFRKQENAFNYVQYPANSFSESGTIVIDPAGHAPIDSQTLTVEVARVEVL